MANLLNIIILIHCFIIEKIDFYDMLKKIDRNKEE